MTLLKKPAVKHVAEVALQQLAGAPDHRRTFSLHLVFELAHQAFGEQDHAIQGRHHLMASRSTLNLKALSFLSCLGELEKWRKISQHHHFTLNAVVQQTLASHRETCPSLAVDLQQFTDVIVFRIQ